MELYISIYALIVSILSLCFSVLVYVWGLQRERKRATLEAFNTLQSQVLDKLNTYTPKEIAEISERPRSPEYKEISSLLARCQHFAVGVNSGVYDLQILRRLAGVYFISIYSKLEPLIQKKRQINKAEKHYDEFERLIQKMKHAKK